MIKLSDLTKNIIWSVAFLVGMSAAYELYTHRYDRFGLSITSFVVLAIFVYIYLGVAIIGFVYYRSRPFRLYDGSSPELEALALTKQMPSITLGLIITKRELRNLINDDSLWVDESRLHGPYRVGDSVNLGVTDKSLNHKTKIEQIDGVNQKVKLALLT